MASKISRDQYKKQQEIEEQRKNGTLPAEVDEEGKDINPHIPEYIKSAPWYLAYNKPTLKHQRMPEEMKKKTASVHEWYERGQKPQATATRYRKGACTNCGALTHKRQDCVERPRKLGAKFTGTNIAPDEAALPEIPLDFDGKHDRWRGYDATQHQQIVEEYEKMEAEKRRLKSEALKEEIRRGPAERVIEVGLEDGPPEEDRHDREADVLSDSSRDSDDSDDEKGYADKVDQPGTKLDTKRRITVRNLRIREDTAKYLRNLDPNSAYYDPKTRTMRANPYAHTGIDPKELTYAGDNFVRYTGEVNRLAQKQIFAWDAAERGMDVHMQADPTMAEIMHKKFQAKKEIFKDTHKSSVLEKYGGEEHLKVPPKELLMAQTEHYAEYSRTGRVIKGQEKAVARSKYEENIYPGNHRSVWGSFWHQGRWGFACCHSFEKLSYCTGKQGQLAAAASAPENMVLSGGRSKGQAAEHAAETATEPKSLVEQHRDKLASENQKDKEKSKKKGKRKHEDDDKSEGEREERERQKRIRGIMRAQEREEEEAQELMSIDERKRPYNALKTSLKEPTEEEMEAYRLRQTRADDPMAAFLTK